MAGVFKSLDQSDVRLTPFRTHKLWYQDFSSLWTNINTWDDNGTWSNSGSLNNTFTIYKANYNPISNYPQSDPLLDSFDIGNSFFTANEPTTSNDKYQRVVHSSIDHLYYKYFYTNNKASFGSGNINRQLRCLEDQAYVISMPQSKFGEMILQNSVQINMSWSYAVVSGSRFNPSLPNAEVSGTWLVVDDGFGNLTISGSQFYSPYGQYVGGAYTNYSSSVDAKVVGEWPFDEVYKYVNIGPFSHTESFNRGEWVMESIYNNVTATNLSSADSAMLGACLQFSSSVSSSITIKPSVVRDYDQFYNFEGGDFAISFVTVPTQAPTHSSGSILVTKLSPAEELQVDLNGNLYSQPAPNKFPYRISYVSESKKVLFEKSTGRETFSLTSSISMSLNTAYHIAAVKSGSLITLYVNSSGSNSVTSASLTFDDSLCRNKSNINIGNSYTGDQGYTGVIDNVKFYREALTENDVKILHHTLGVGNVHIGNVFYNHGMMVLTSVPTRYSKIYNTECRGSHTIYEKEVSCTINPGEFGMSCNPTLEQYDPVTNQFVYRPFVTGSDFKPFVTSVGLYDDFGNLLVIGKLNTPIQLPNNMDTTIIVRYDR